jgi:hypothetical protein
MTIVLNMAWRIRSLEWTTSVFLVSNHFAIFTFISNGFHPKKKESEQSQRNGCLIGSPGKWLSCIFVEANVFYDTIA